MKVRVEIRQMRFFAGNVEMTKEEYHKLKDMRDDKEMDIVKAVMLKSGIKQHDQNWDLEVFLNLDED